MAITSRKLSDLHTWAGDAATAAKNAAGKTRVDLDAHGREVWKVAAAARDCYNEAVALKRSARAVQADADASNLDIDPTSGSVTDPNPPDMRGWSEEDKKSYYAEIKARQNRVNEVVAAADRFDDDLAAAINAADGSIPLTPPGEGEQVNLADRQANQVAAFRSSYGRDPSTSNDWRMAEALDPHTYDPKYRGEKSKVTVARIKPSHGNGMSRANLYIPSQEVQNVTVNPLDIADGRGLPHNIGDNRGPNPNAAPENSRVSVFVDHENGLIVARQNPTVVTSGPNPPKAGMPEVKAIQTEDGSVRIKYFGVDAYQPAGATILGIGVEGDIALQPQPSDNVSASGTVTYYPSAEIYHYGTDGSIDTLADYRAIPSEAGPMNNLFLGLRHSFGSGDNEVPQILEPGVSGGRLRVPGRNDGDFPGYQPWLARIAASCSDRRRGLMSDEPAQSNVNNGAAGEARDVGRRHDRSDFWISSMVRGIALLYFGCALVFLSIFITDDLQAGNFSAGSVLRNLGAAALWSFVFSIGTFYVSIPIATLITGGVRKSWDWWRRNRAGDAKAGGSAAKS